MHFISSRILHILAAVVLSSHIEIRLVARVQQCSNFKEAFFMELEQKEMKLMRGFLFNKEAIPSVRKQLHGGERLKGPKMCQEGG